MKLNSYIKPSRPNPTDPSVRSNPMFKNVCLSDVRLRVSALSETLRFYSETVGLRVITADSQRAELSANGQLPALLILEQCENAPERPAGSAGLFHVALLYPNRIALANAVAQVICRKHPLQGAADHAVSEAIYLADPEGNGLELYADRPPQAWPRRGHFVNMATKPLAMRELFAMARPASDTYSIPVETRIGHLHLNVTSLAEAEDVFAGLLHMPVRQRNFSDALFFGYNDYHHHIAVNTWDTLCPARTGALGLESITLRLNPDLALDDLPSVFDLSGIAIRRGLMAEG